ncbi:GreA/GreB family elongation factor [Bengtsoniella intestinalis]|uniref:GreA/GreB family elongation factor n=1 Tax=Bengtsoniella intestinalis TaxID=3073143 RepID=UPI00391F0FA5
MHDELTQVDLDKMKQELTHRIQTLRPKLIEEVQEARAHGDLSENFEYRCAKQAKNRNDSRIRYLQAMVRTAKVITIDSDNDAIGLFDTVTVYNSVLKKEQILRIVTTLRQNVLQGLISKESPAGVALLGKQVGDIVTVTPEGRPSYTMEVRHIQKGTDDDSLDIAKY